MIIKDLEFIFYSDCDCFTDEEITNMCFDVCAKMGRITKHLKRSNKSKYTWKVADQIVIKKSSSYRGLSEFHCRTLIDKMEEL